jgi:hypothetical protein
MLLSDPGNMHALSCNVGPALKHEKVSGWWHIGVVTTPSTSVTVPRSATGVLHPEDVMKTVGANSMCEGGGEVKGVKRAPSGPKLPQQRVEVGGWVHG